MANTWIECPVCGYRIYDTTADNEMEEHMIKNGCNKKRREFYASYGKNRDNALAVMTHMNDDARCSFESGDVGGDIGYIEDATIKDIEVVREEYYRRMINYD